MNVREQQTKQNQHDLKNHFDIISLSRADRLKHYGLHFAKYAGRLAREEDESKSVDQTIVDIFLVCLSSANAMNQGLVLSSSDKCLSFKKFTSYSGNFCNACEKIDHLEEFRKIAIEANQSIFEWVVSYSAQLEGSTIELMSEKRRKEISQRLVY